MKAPSDTVLRERLDAVSPSLLRGAFRRVLHLLQRGKGLEDFTWWAGHYLLSVDGTTKNDCERNAVKRLLADVCREHPHLKLIVVEDALAANGPHIELLQSLKMILAFLVDQVQQHCCGLFQAALVKQGRNRYFREKLRSFFFTWLLPDRETLHRTRAYGSAPTTLVACDTS